MTRTLTALALVVALASASACGGPDPAPAATVPPATATSSSPAPIPTRNEQVATVCRLNREAADRLMETGAVKAVADAAVDAGDLEIERLAAAMFDRYRDAVLAQGTEDELSTQSDLLTAHTELDTACVEAGFGA